MPEVGRDSVLVVDLDGTLIASDLLFEALWAAVSQARFGLLARGAGLLRQPAALKRLLGGNLDFPVEFLPYNAEVIAYATRWKEAGGRVVLATASDEVLARKVADHLGIFDAVHASDGAKNLKGAAKAALLVEKYGAGNFVYMGDAEADLPVWSEAGGRVTVNAGAGLRARVDGLGAGAEHLRLRPGRPGPWLRALRPHQWLKNMLVFIPMLASHNLSVSVLMQSLGAFIVFSLAASSVYVINDLVDLAADRAHPRKRLRPLAAGEIPIGRASLLAGVLFGAGLLLALIFEPLLAGVLVIYYLMTLAYSLYLKQRTIVDIWVLSVLYTLRILGGAAATGIVPSVWLMAFSIFFFFSLAAVKRQAELVDLVQRDGSSVQRRGYHRDDLLLIAMMAIAAGYVSVLVMALYIRTPFIDELYSFPPALFGICLILLYWISRIVMVTHRGHMHDDPLLFALHDRVSRFCLGAMVVVALAAAWL